MDEAVIQSIVDQVVRKMHEAGLDPARRAAPAPAPASPVAGLHGVFENVDDAVRAGSAAQKQFRNSTMEVRRAIIETIRLTGHAHKEDWARKILDETKIGRVDHKIRKHEVVIELTPGVEDLTTRCYSGDRGLTVEEYAPFGLIGAVTPVTHPVETMINNSISILAGGNTVCFNAHPASQRIFAEALAIMNDAIQKASGYRNLLTCIAVPTIESGRELFSHPLVRLLLVTGGPGVVKEALATPKRAITAGPGNPPVVVDETAVIPQAARDIIAGASFDNNVLCIGEKEVFVVERVADALIAELRAQGCVLLDAAQVEELAAKALDCTKCTKDSAGRTCGGAVINRDFVGRDAYVLARAIGLDVPRQTPLLIGETNFEHTWVQTEQMMPFLPIVRCRDIDEAIRMAVDAEHGYRHTAVIHSLNVAAMTKMGKAMDCSIFVKNGPSYAGLGAGGEGPTSFSIASPTGEGCTSARTFCRIRRCTLVDYLRIV